MPDPEMHGRQPLSSCLLNSYSVAVFKFWGREKHNESCLFHMD
jgi:hypothetical protein